MSDATEPRADADPDAWATACEEDLAAERARRRERYGTPPGSAAEELRRLADAVAGKLADLGAPLPPAARNAAQQFVAQARAAVEPVVERNPRVFDHLAAAGGELLAAYRAVVEGQEQRWTRRDTGRDGGDRGAEDHGAEDPGAGDRSGPRRDGGDGPTGSEKIDLD
ncbi:MAG TPA: DUF5304 family protein [Streptomyces sp.]|nr:DUF5304 family protein [Streptomyces sp.]